MTDTNPSHSTQHATMLVELDAILDTRYGTIAKFGIPVLAKALTHGYFSRSSDHFCAVEPKEYFNLYRERDAVTLSMSTITHVVSILKDFVRRVHITAASSPVHKTPTLDINIHPYKLDEKITAKIERALRVLIDDKVNINFVDYRIDELTYDLVRASYDHMCMYNIGPFIEHHAKDWEKRNKGLPDLTVFTPALCRTENFEEVPEDITSMTDEISRVLSPILNVMFLPIPFFCTVVNPYDIKSVKPETSPEPEGSGEDQVN